MTYFKAYCVHLAFANAFKIHFLVLFASLLTIPAQHKNVRLQKQDFFKLKGPGRSTRPSVALTGNWEILKIVKLLRKTVWSSEKILGVSSGKEPCEHRSGFYGS